MTTAAAGLAVLGAGTTPWGQGEALVTSRFPWHQVQALAALDAGDWQPGDVLLQRAGFLEGDLRHLIPEAQRRHVEGVLAAPYTTLYVAAQRRPCVVLSLSQRRGAQIATSAGAATIRAASTLMRWRDNCASTAISGSAATTGTGMRISPVCSLAGRSAGPGGVRAA